MVIGQTLFMTSNSSNKVHESHLIMVVINIIKTEEDHQVVIIPSIIVPENQIEIRREEMRVVMIVIILIIMIGRNQSIIDKIDARYVRMLDKMKMFQTRK